MDKSWILYIIIALMVLFISVVLLKSGTQKQRYRLKTFLTKNEKDCFYHLKKIFPEYHICPQVSMGAILEPLAKMSSSNASERSQNAIHRNMISSKVIDFVMMNKNLEPVFIIELDDNTHNSKLHKDRERDTHITLAGLKTVRIRRNKNTFPSRAYFDKALEG